MSELEELNRTIRQENRQVVLRQMGEEVFAWCTRKGWEPDPARTFGDECALIHSEVSEALEAFREWGFEARYKFMSEGGGYSILPPDDPNAQRWMAAGQVPEPEGVASEFADVLVRLLHYWQTRLVPLGFDFATEFERKMAYNERRPYRHGGKAL